MRSLQRKRAKCVKNYGWQCLLTLIEAVASRRFATNEIPFSVCVFWRILRPGIWSLIAKGFFQRLGSCMMLVVGSGWFDNATIVCLITRLPCSGLGRHSLVLGDAGNTNPILSRHPSPSLTAASNASLSLDYTMFCFVFFGSWALTICEARSCLHRSEMCWQRYATLCIVRDLRLLCFVLLDDHDVAWYVGGMDLHPLHH